MKLCPNLLELAVGIMNLEPKARLEVQVFEASESLLGPDLRAEN